MVEKVVADLRAIAKAAMERYGFRSGFPPEALEEAAAYTEETAAREADSCGADLCSLPWSSIDNSNSLDLDQVECCEEGASGEIIVRVGIADIESVLRGRPALDARAAFNGISVYTGVETFPMLPGRLSYGLSSLAPGKTRPAIVIEFSVGRDGTVAGGKVFRAAVRNGAALHFGPVGEWFGGGAAPPDIAGSAGLRAQLKLQAEAARRLRGFRLEQGALELETLEIRPVVHEETVTALISPRENPANYLIENFMVAANQVMVEFLVKAGRPSIERVVRAPKDWEGIRRLAATLGEELPAAPDGRSLSRFLIARKEAAPGSFADLSLAVIKMLGPGEYLACRPQSGPCGHFGLAMIDYTHGTAPNRRYVDVIIQRLVKALICAGPVPYTFEELTVAAGYYTLRDKAGKKAERFVHKACAASLLEKRIGDVFGGIVTGASSKGTYVRIFEPHVEGRVVRGYEGMRVGEKVRVRLRSLEPYKGFIDFEKVTR